MEELPYGEDPEPSDRFPAGPLYVPVRPGPSGSVVRLFRTPLGDRSAVGFTSARGLAAALGTGQAWIRLAEPALRALTAPLGVTTVTIDPPSTARAPAGPAVRGHMQTEWSRGRPGSTPSYGCVTGTARRTSGSLSRSG
ncbi:SAV_915 family protein [Streptomyces sp. WELS2]|uniref:SAV_915 family protein n=1 Tax=Streptomyces sp. WELS2 TaxID=2749435 RepID=UPI00215D7661|nr:SAV_915 family protein [Streptomyces sp. WELS2]